MGLFDNMKDSQEQAKEKQSAKQQAKIDKFLKQRGLDNLSLFSYNAVRRTMTDQAGLGLLKAGMALDFSKVEERAKINYLSSLSEQNWILIQQNDQLMKQNTEIYKLLQQIAQK
ncbi:hypothetical protein I6N96_03375 [Enterococcus sp. BWM-S5]|uniref:Uncharacterized protein n=1 Tax=Enterococcus larvae TaxID=2794352 RepID=A0ABS4CFT6_9ENTE|nr:hypothetical protein [Enterococcus larvae]MBP1045304.1 hypothetical protein [Enterococcus larvae]